MRLSLRHLVIRAAGITAFLYLALFALYLLAYFRKNQTFVHSDFMQLSFLSIGIGILFGILVIWLVFPRLYAPQASHDFFPKAILVGGWFMVIFPILYIILDGTSPFDISNARNIIRDSQNLTDLSMLGAFAIVNLFSSLTYCIFFSALKFWFEKQNSKASTSSPLS